MDTIKDSHDMAPKEAEEIKKRWQEYTEELQKKDLNDSDNPDNDGHLPRARYPGVWNQVGIRKNYYKLLQNCAYFAASKVMFKILQARLQ